MMARLDRRYAPLASQPMRAGAIVRQPALGAARRVTLDDPALSVMTDLTRVPVVPVDPDVGPARRPSRRAAACSRGAGTPGIFGASRCFRLCRPNKEGFP